MEHTESQVIDSLLFRNIDAETDRNLARHVFWKAYGILDPIEPVGKSGVLYASQDDGVMLSVKEKAIVYQSEQGSCRLVLTNMYHGRLADKVRNDVISLEILPEEPVNDGSWHSRVFSERGEVLFSITKEGEIESPLQLIEATIADSLVDLFMEETLQNSTTNVSDLSVELL
jgi:hypothetical protein